MAMSKYETMIWEEKMIEKILVNDRLKAHAHALFVEKYPGGSVFNVIQATTTDEDGYVKQGATLIETHLVVYKAPSTAEKWELVLSSDKVMTVEEGLEVLWGNLRSRLSEKFDRERESLVEAFVKSLVGPARF
ncbi:hypothetical protein J4E89_006877 [Alternaria sp. Ai002NY15]|nr:hypothetical protein J4E89_006877 [Alternaria sp. Ai002NY15]